MLSGSHSALLMLGEKTMKLLCTTIVATLALTGTSLTGFSSNQETSGRQDINHQESNRDKIILQSVFTNVDYQPRNLIGGDIDCACNATYSVGDRVLLVNDWEVGNGPSEGMLGTVLCGVALGSQCNATKDRAYHAL